MSLLNLRSPIQILALAAALLLAVNARQTCAQGYQVESAEIDIGDVGAQENSYAAEQTTSIYIDDDMNIDAYSEVYGLGGDDENDNFVESIEMALLLTVNGTPMDSGSSSADPWGVAAVELFDQGQLGNVYGAEGFSTVIYNDSGGYFNSGESYAGPWGFYGGSWGYFDGDSNDDGFGDTIFAGDLYDSVNTGPPPPYVDHITPAGGTVGDQGKWITFYGDNLFNSNGNLPYFSIGGTGTLSVTAQGGNPGGQSSTPSQLFATYSIAPGNQLMMDPIIDVITDAGTSNDTNFTIGDAPATITSLSPPNWTAGTSFTLTITGTGFGSNPNVSITDPNNAVSTGNFTSSPDGTSIQIGVTVNGNAQPGDVASVTVTPAGLINGAMGYYPGSPSDPQSGQSQPATAEITPAPPPPWSEITVIGWINGAAITLPTGESTALFLALNVSSTACAAEVATWALGQPGFLSDSPNDPAYANAWLLKYSANDPPPSSINPVVEGNLGILGAYRLFNDFQVSTGPNVGTVAVGWTPDPCGFSPVPIPADSSNQWNGWIGTTPTTVNTYQIAQARVGSVGQRVYATLNNGATVPWIWSVVEFDSYGNPVMIGNPANYQVFPTFTVYVNGTVYATYPQSSVASILQLNDTSEITPSLVQ